MSEMMTPPNEPNAGGGYFLTPINWFMVVYMLLTHIGAIYGLYRTSSMAVFLETIVWYQVCGWGVTAGMHRLWSHRSYTAALPTRIFLILLASMSNQGSIYHWARDHRVHHRHSDTSKDPHDITRGVFYAHMGWLLLKKYDEVKEAGKKIDCEDLLQDWVVKLNHDLNPLWDQFWAFGVPGLYGIWRLGSFWDGVFIFGMLRWVIEVHSTWCVNSVAHTWGYRPYRANVRPCESLVTSLLANGEGWHNWHHAYPHDYAAAEDSFLFQWNHTKLFIDVLGLVGQTSNFKRHKVR